MATAARVKRATSPPKLRISVAASGRTASVTFPRDALAEIARGMAPGPMRTQIEQAVARADDYSGRTSDEARLETVLSIESLAQVGWMMTGDHSPLAYGAIRQGDFRRVELGAGSGWEFGPPGAFDREPNGVPVLKDAVQAGVMSETHHAYRLLDPTVDQESAVDAAERLAAEWRSALPPKRKRPVGLDPDGCTRDALRHRVARQQWDSYYGDADMALLPDGARLSRGRERIWSGAGVLHTLPEDERPHRVGTRPDGTSVTIYQFEAVLSPDVRVDPERGRGRTFGMAWAFGRRDHDPRFEPARGHKPFDGPYHCVLGRVWTAVHNHVARLHAFERDDVDVYATREQALAAADVHAHKLGILDEAPRAPTTIPVPDYGREGF